MQTVRLNLANNAATQYSNFDFNSMCRFNGEVLGAGAKGLFKLQEGQHDSQIDIQAYFIPATTNFGDIKKKASRYVYISGQMIGDLSIDFVGDGINTAGPYLCTPNSNEGIQQRRVTLGRGFKFNWVRARISNVDGSDFMINAVSLFLDTNTHASK